MIPSDDELLVKTPTVFVLKSNGKVDKLEEVVIFLTFVVSLLTSIVYTSG